ncbi:DinB family protein [Paenibacillus sacheonensis]|uniref:Damage-inducible protein DinB n=1 Tax=Paenibacillus sacheonensis TaxID=742054 RepID=A0A7X4YKF8_9BACL|nr:DinB family protein [Paenibacillus sacheonensis]MBM7563415.1 putative damage-inducible protein DinB [Paenibacillus sacheonensis]NBC68030.1 damage-inducible protein DinB [Paenibacillus sacheonensis]
MTNLDEFIGGWLSHRKVLHEMLKDVTTEQLQLKPYEKGMSLSALVLHITGAMGMFAATAKNGTYTKGEPSQPFTTSDELRASILADTEHTEAVLRSLTPEQLSASIDFFGRSLSGGALLQNGKEHEIHHKGQLFIYLRMAGIEQLPFYVSKG